MHFQDFLNEYRISYVTEGKYASTGWLQFDCPFCDGGSDPDKPYCGYNLAGNYVNCWRCGGHSVAQTMKELSGLSWTEIKKLVGSLEVDRSIIYTPLRGKLEYPEGVGPLQKVHKKYLRSRGFDPQELVALWGIQGIGLAPRLSWRIFIPVQLNGQTVSWTTRKISDVGSRYVSASAGQEIVSIKELLLGEDYCRHIVIVCEGPFDVFRIGPGAVAVLGTGIKPAQLNKISKFVERYICFDNEPAAQVRAQKLAEQLAIFPGHTYNIQLDAKDPGSASEKEIKKLRKLLK